MGNINGTLLVGEWSVGQGSDGLYQHLGPLENNVRVIDSNPCGVNDIVWKSQATGQQGYDGGFCYKNIQIEDNTTYRFTVWVKKSGTDGDIYFGSDQYNTQRIDETATDDLYFFSENLPTVDEWYLLVAHIHPSGYPTGGLNHSETGLYKFGSTEKVSGVTINDFKQVGGTTSQSIRAFMYRSESTDSVTCIYGPRVEVQDENTIALSRILNEGQVWSSERNVWNESTWANGPQGPDGTYFPMSALENNVIVKRDNKMTWCVRGNPSQADGGWNKVDIKVDPTKTYRFTVFVRREGVELLNGKTFLGCDKATTNNLDGTPNDNPYFWSGYLPRFDRWYLLVGFIHPSDYTGPISSDTGLRDVVTGQKVPVGTVNNFKHKEGSKTQTHRAYYYYSTSGVEKQYMWMPRVDETNGTEPSIDTLISMARDY